jgi:glycosyltransferase A (GT-A) superfamily protein (DUF2064 family)
MKSPAVVLFARSPEGEAAAKGMRSAAPLFRAVVAAWLRESRRHGAMPIIACTREDRAALGAIAPEIQRRWIEQRGATFGDRVVHAAEDAFARGFASVILAAIDAPPHDLRRAIDALQRGIPVLAPARDGGVNYLGITSVDRELLANLTAQRCRAHFAQLLIVNTLTDVDSTAALNSARLERAWQPFLQVRPIASATFIAPRSAIIRSTYIRPPPR